MYRLRPIKVVRKAVTHTPQRLTNLHETTEPLPPSLHSIREVVKNRMDGDDTAVLNLESL